MRILAIHCGQGMGVAWVCHHGLPLTLTRMGHQVTDWSMQRGQAPPMGYLTEADVIIMTGPEWYAETLLKAYPNGEWQGLRAKKAALHCESYHRDDRDFIFYPELADMHFFPAVQDAEEFGGVWMPFGADHNHFYDRHMTKKWDAAFMGSLYPKREQFIQENNLKIAQVSSEITPDVRRTADQLSETYNRVKIFVNFPALSRLMVTKVTEVMMSGTFLLQPRIDHPSAVENEIFEDGKHLCYYSNAAELRELIDYYTEHEDEREEIAAAGCTEVLMNHRFDSRLYDVLEALTI